MNQDLEAQLAAAQQEIADLNTLQAQNQCQAMAARARADTLAAMLAQIREKVAAWREEARVGRDGIGAFGGVPISHAHAMATILRAERDANDLQPLLDQIEQATR